MAVLAAGTAGGAGLGAALGECSSGTCDDGLPSPVAGALVGYLFYPAAVWGGAELVDGRGHLAGAYAGAVVAAGGTVALGALIEDDGAVLLSSGLLLLIAPIVGSELGSALSNPSPPSSLQLLPTAQVRREGWTVGLGGRF